MSPADFMARARAFVAKLGQKMGPAEPTTILVIFDPITQAFGIDAINARDVRSVQLLLRAALNRSEGQDPVESEIPRDPPPKAKPDA